MTWLAAPAEATTIAFENFAPAGSLVNVSPGVPYTESGYTFTPTGSQSAVFDSAAATDMPGDATDFFGFEENNFITLTFGGGGFDLTSLLIGPTTLSGGTTSMTIVGNLAGGGSVVRTFSNLTTATLAQLNWINLSSVLFRVTDDSALDDLEVTAVRSRPLCSCSVPALRLLSRAGVASLERSDGIGANSRADRAALDDISRRKIGANGGPSSSPGSPRTQEGVAIRHRCAGVHGHDAARALLLDLVSALLSGLLHARARSAMRTKCISRAFGASRCRVMSIMYVLVAAVIALLIGATVAGIAAVHSVTTSLPAPTARRHH